MSHLQLFFTSLKKTDKRVQDLPKWPFFVPAISVATVAMIVFYLTSPFLPTWTTKTLIASITMSSLAFSGVGVLSSYFIIVTFVFATILLEEKRREDEKNSKSALDELRKTIKETLPEILDKNEIATNKSTKKALDLANRSYQKHDELINKHQEEIDENKTDIHEIKEILLRDLRISELARSKLRNQRNQSKRELDEERQLTKSLGNEIDRLWSEIARLVKTILKLKGD